MTVYVYDSAFLNGANRRKLKQIVPYFENLQENPDLLQQIF